MKGLGVVVFYLALQALFTVVFCDIFAIGDIHGDYDQFRKALLLTGVVERQPNKLHLVWKNSAEGHHYIVLTGDLMDRGPFEAEIMIEVASLQRQANEICAELKCGFIPLLGNHEVLNLCGDIRYMHECYIEGILAASQGANSQTAMNACVNLLWQQRTQFVRESVQPVLAGWKIVAKLDTPLGATVFVHGGIEPHIAKLGINVINKYAMQCSNPMKGDALGDEILGNNGPLWSRLYTHTLSGDNSKVCGMLRDALSSLGATRMVVGHSIQSDITAACDGSLIFIDIGLSKWISVNTDGENFGMVFPQVKILHIDKAGRALKRSANGDNKPLITQTASHKVEK